MQLIIQCLVLHDAIKSNFTTEWHRKHTNAHLQKKVKLAIRHQYLTLHPM